MKRRALFAFKLAVTIGLSAWLVHGIFTREGAAALGARLGSLRAEWIALAIALQLLAAVTGVLRWRLILRAGGLELPFRWLLRSFLIGRFVGAFTPSTTGLDGWRIYEVSRTTGASGRSTAAIVVEKLVGLLSMATVCAALVPFGARALLGDAAIVTAIAIAICAAAGLIAVSRPAWMARLFARLPWIGARAERIAHALGRMKLDRSRMAAALSLGVCSHLALSAVFFATARAIGLTADAGALLVLGNAIVLAVLLPVSIGGIGVRESVAALLLASAAVSRTDAVLVALLGYATGQVPALIGGLCMAVGRRVEREPRFEPAESTLSP